ncbi:MAG: hypothetical protein EAZ91_22930 [Cytophagales bacterium]|nr:MAG: hypothetical protein EAZ91_22930 [Cytophagales bacterium]
MKPFLFLLLCALSACGPTTPQTAPKPVYFDVAGYVKDQIGTLEKAKPTVTKQALISGKTNNQTTSTIDWAKELELFLQADINKPAFRTSYAVARPDSLTYEYTLKPSEEKLTVRALTIQLDADTQKPVRIEALLKTENPLYTSERHLWLESGADRRTGWGIRKYRVEGFQQLTYFDRNTFRVEARVN